MLISTENDRVGGREERERCSERTNDVARSKETDVGDNGHCNLRSYQREKHKYHIEDNEFAMLE
jgi:hypothetical protein